MKPLDTWQGENETELHFWRRKSLERAHDNCELRAEVKEIRDLLDAAYDCLARAHWSTGSTANGHPLLATAIDEVYDRRRELREIDEDESDDIGEL